jgi:hypothetical protein
MATREQLIEDFADHKYATGEKFERLINSMKVVQEPVADPAASGTSLSFIASIEQNADGKITATKKTLDLANAHELNPFKGWWRTGDTLPTSGFDGAYLYFKDTAQSPAVTTIYRWNGTTYADTGTVVDESKVQTFATGQAVNTVGIDDGPITGSGNLVKSGGIQNELAIGAVYDVSAKNPTAGPNNDGKFESLSALLTDGNLNTLIPISYRKGGMSIKFVQSSDNKYVQYLLIKDDWSANEGDWEKMNLEDEVTENSDIIGNAPKWEQGGIDESGRFVDSAYRIRTNIVQGPISITLKSGYSIFRIAKYANDGTFEVSEYVGYASGASSRKVSEKGNYRIVVCKTGGTDAILPTSDFLEDYEGGLVHRVEELKKDTENELHKLHKKINRYVVPEFESGSLDDAGNDVSSSKRARSLFITGGFHITLKSGYSIFRVLRYSNNVASILYNGGVSGSSAFECYDDSYTYRVVVCKTGGEDDVDTFDFIDSFINGAELRAERFIGNTWENYTIDSHGEAVANSNRLTYFFINGVFKIGLKPGYSIFKVVKYNSNFDFVGTEFFGGLSGVTKYETKDDTFIRSIQISKTDGTGIAPSDDFIDYETLTPSKRITEINGMVSGNSPKWEQGGIGEDGRPVSSPYRVRTNTIHGPFQITLKSGYSIFRIAKYADDGTFEVSEYAGYASGASSREVTKSGNFRIVVCKTGGTESVLPTDNFVKSYIGGLVQRVSNLEKESDNRLVKKIVSTNYVYSGEELVRPTSPEDVYGIYNDLYTKYPQFVNRTLIGKSRDTFEIAVPNRGLLPFCIETPVDVSNYSSLEIGGISYTIEDIYSFGGYWYVRLHNATNGSVINESGNIAYNGTTIGTYRRGLYGRYNAKLGTSEVYIIKGISNKLIGIILDGSTPSDSGNLYDEDNNILSSYSSLQNISGDNIYRYDFDFSANRTNKVGIIGIIGGVHSGSEPQAVLGLSTFFRELCENWSNSDDLAFARMARYSVVPLVNPWGLRNTVSYNAHGIDLNRNFSEGFTQTNMLYFRWGGDSALSEPEAVAVNNFFIAIKNDAVCVFDFHNDGTVGGNFQPSQGASIDWINALSICLSQNANRNYQDIPTFLFAWKNETSIVYTNTPVPTTSDVAYTSVYGPTAPITSVSNGVIVVNGTTYSRDTTDNVDYTNLFPLHNQLPNGSAIMQAYALGLNNSTVSECGGWYYIPAVEQLQFNSEVTANVLIVTVKYFLS